MHTRQVVNQTTLESIHLHCMEKKNTQQKKAMQIWNNMRARVNDD